MNRSPHTLRLFQTRERSNIALLLKRPAATSALFAFAYLLALEAMLLSVPLSAASTPLHLPALPRSDEPVTITAKAVGPPFPSVMWLHYQSVDPGNYVALSDEAFETNWHVVAMNDKGIHGDQSSQDGQFTVTLPSHLQKHRRLVRYWVNNSPAITRYADHHQEHSAYFVYDGVPDWHGAINPASAEPRIAKKQRFLGSALTRVPVYHLISKESWIEEATWRKGANRRRRHSDSSYFHTGTFVGEDRVYDHVKFRARGGVWRHAMGKNMWKINFPGNHPFQARDNYGRPYRAPWDKLNLGAGIQQGQYGLRGEHGLFDALSYRLFNLAGTFAPATHWIHLRIIDEEDESPENQYEGDFWGLYLAVENIDEAFLQHHQLSDGHLYKIEILRPFTRYVGTPFQRAPDIAHHFIRQLTRKPPSDQWWSSQVNLDQYYRYRSVVESVHHYDIGNGKNYFFYYDAGQSKWQTIPWDVDLTWGEHMYGSGRDPFRRAGILDQSQRLQDYLERLAEHRDLLFNPEQMNRLIREQAHWLYSADRSQSLVDADRAKWDYHPIMASRYVTRHQAGQGKFYFSNPSSRFDVIIRYLQGFVAKRSKWIDDNLLNKARFPGSPEIVMERPRNNFSFSSASHPESLLEWRLAAVTPPRPASGTPGKYETQIIHQEVAQGRFTLQAEDLAPQEIYRVRARLAAADGERSRWSPAIEFSLTP